MMGRRLLAALAAILALAACQGDRGPDIVIRDVQIFAPVPGSVTVHLKPGDMRNPRCALNSYSNAAPGAGSTVSA